MVTNTAEPEKKAKETTHENSHNGKRESWQTSVSNNLVTKNKIYVKCPLLPLNQRSPEERKKNKDL